MEYKLLKKEGNEIAFEIAFDAMTFEKALIYTYREVTKDDKNKVEVNPFLSMAALIENHPRAMEITRETIKKIVSDHYDTAIRDLGIVSVSDPYIQPVQVEIGQPLVVMIKTFFVSDACNLKFEGLKATYTELYIDGTEIDEKLYFLCHYYGVSNNEELIAKMNRYDNIASLRYELERSLVEFLEKCNFSNKQKATIDALLAANPMDVSADEINKYIMNQIQKIKNQVGGEIFEQQLKSSDRSLDNVKAMIRKDVGFMPHLNHILTSIAAHIHFEITDEDRLKEIAAEKEQSLHPERMDSVEDTLRKLQQNPEILRSLDYKVSLNKALEYVMEKAELTVKNRFPIKERMHQQFR